jgi:pimeloyl-ACP methyl ester carboxylesterase
MRQFKTPAARWMIGAVCAGIVSIFAIWGLYSYADPEKLELDAAARKSAPGAFVSLTDGYTHYELSGPADARVVVLAAGYSVPYYIWDPTFTALTGAGFHVLRYDYYGRGYSDRPEAAYTLDFHVRQLKELLSALQIDTPVDLVGLSFGASVVTRFADKYSDKVRSLVYFDPSFRRPYYAGSTARWPFAWNLFTVLFEERWWPNQQLADFLRPERFPDWPQRYRAQTQYKGFRKARLSEIVSNADVDQDEEVKRVGRHPRPVLLIWGKQDRNVPFEESEWVLKAMPRARLVAVDRAGHLPQWEQPDLVNQELLNFWRGTAQSGIPPQR